MTDANLVLGRLQPEFFPHIFGPHDNEPLDADATHAAFAALTVEINAYTSSHAGEHVSVTDAALGFIRVANEAMW